MKPDRLNSLDAFRGFIIAGMILVNNPSSWVKNRYPQLMQSDWNGWTLHDIIFPTFLWIMGVSMTLSFATRKTKGDNNNKIIFSVLRRSAIIFGLGIFLNGLWWNHFSNIVNIRIPGVLQRIAICYLITSILYLYFSIRTIIISIAVLFISYTIMMFYIPIPEYGAGLFEQGRNFASYIDSILLPGHLSWKTQTWDTEGVIGTIPAIASTLFGILVGEYIRSSTHVKYEKSAWLFTYGAGFILLGSIFDMWMPINMKLWTVSYAIFMAGWSMCLFAIFYFLIDAKGIKKWTYPFTVYGMNSILIYVLSMMAQSAMNLRLFNVWLSDGSYAYISIDTILTDNLIDPYFNSLNASLVHAIVWVCVMYLIALVLYKKKWFVKI